MTYLNEDILKALANVSRVLSDRLSHLVRDLISYVLRNLSASVAVEHGKKTTGGIAAQFVLDRIGCHKVIVSDDLLSSM